MPVMNKTIDDKGAGLRLDRWLREAYPDLPFSVLQKALRTGQVRLDGKRVKGNERIVEGQSVRIPPQFDHVFEAKPKKPKHFVSDEDAQFIRGLVIYQDENIIAINKPSGIASQGGTDTFRHIDGMLSALKEFPGDERPRLVHRLDRDTSGVLLLARHRKAAASLGKAFMDHRIEKTYLAITVGVPNPREGTIKAPLLKMHIGGQDKVVVDREGKRALTDYRVLDHAAHTMALVELKPMTGRQHQLRAHLSYLETPVLGDNKYDGDGQLFGEKKLYLHARRIDFDDPFDHKRTITIKADLSEHFKRLVDDMEFCDDTGCRL